MASRSNTLAHSKRIENAAARFFWGPGARRDWKCEWDVAGQAPDGTWYIIEVKAAAVATPGQLYSLLVDALGQAEGYIELFRAAHGLEPDWPVVPVAAVWPKRSRTRFAAVRHEYNTVAVYTWADLRRFIHNGEPDWA